MPSSISATKAAGTGVRMELVSESSVEGTGIFAIAGIGVAMGVANGVDVFVKVEVGAASESAGPRSATALMSNSFRSSSSSGVKSDP